METTTNRTPAPWLDEYTITAGITPWNDDPSGVALRRLLYAVAVLHTDQATEPVLEEFAFDGTRDTGPWTATFVLRPTVEWAPILHPADEAALRHDDEPRIAWFTRLARQAGLTPTTVSYGVRLDIADTPADPSDLLF